MVWMIGLLAVVMGLSYVCYWIAFYNPESRHGERVDHSKGIQYRKYLRRLNELSYQLEHTPYEQVYITAHDGIRLAARYYHVSDGAPLLIQFHGYRGSGVRDFCGGCTLAQKLGYNVLLVDQRAHGLSGGDTMTFGIIERYDCKSWAQYASNRFGPQCKIILYGISMGASTVLMALSLELPEQVAGVIADSPFSSPRQIIQKVCADLKLPGVIIYPFVMLGAMLFGRFRIWEMDCEKAVRDADIPILLIHGGDDRFVPGEMSWKIFESCNQGKLEIFPGAGHVLCFVSDEARYENIVKEFIKNCL